MDILNNEFLFSFLLDGAAAADCVLSSETRRTPAGEARTYRFPGGLTVTTVITLHPSHGAAEWVNVLENVSDEPTGIISELWDCDVSLPVAYEPANRWTAVRPTPEESTNIYAPFGSDLSADEFNYRRHGKNSFERESILFTGKEKSFTPSGGRSSQGTAPFFNVHKQGEGYFFAVGWSGQWNARFARSETALRVRAGVENARFRLLPGERVRTCSAVLMPYTAALPESFNLWRRLLRDCFAPVGQPGRAQAAPLSAMLWGGMPTGEILRRVKALDEYAIPVDTVWIDAGWYGCSEKPSPDEFEGDWAEHTGDWRVNPRLHPDGLRDVAATVHAGGRKLLLWAEPERARVTAPAVTEHPSRFFRPVRPQDKDRLLNLGDGEAWADCLHTLSDLIDRLQLDWYRQDFNMDPLPVWCFNDAPDRLGMSEILHINGLYKLWDALLERFPHLMIDNCASGGRRIDVETLRRSVPLWRSDMQCVENCRPEVSQAHSLTFCEWLPYSGTGADRSGSLYRLRGCYAAALGLRSFYSENRPIPSPDEAEALRAQCEEYLRVRPYFSEDVYALTVPGEGEDLWSAQQLHRPADGTGAVLVFRREASPYETACFPLSGLDQSKSYAFYCPDTGERAVYGGNVLAARGLPVGITEKGASRLYFYQPEA